ncbi:MAG: phosphotransferase [Phycisphaerales bacterium]|nr:phosphotransferase [Phycisphaerales bacterium]
MAQMAQLQSSSMPGNGAEGGGSQGAPAPESVSERFDPFELAIVLSHYELGVIRSIGRLRRGSVKTPKLLITTDRGQFVLKRRSADQADPLRVRFAHAVQTRLASSGFPLPPLVPTRAVASDASRSLFVIKGRSYELFRFSSGQGYDKSTMQTFAAGQGLAMFHNVTSPLASAHEPSSRGLPASYHDNEMIPSVLRELAMRMTNGADANFLAEMYEAAASRVNNAGFDRWPVQVIHGDWHPGNAIFHGDRLVAVIDYDTARLGRRALDIASAAVQFSIEIIPGDPGQWPSELDEARLVAMIRGYESLTDADGHPLEHISRAELGALPDLMIESLIAETAGPIATTGAFGLHGPAKMLGVTRRKAQWIADHGDRLARAFD